MKKLFQFKKSGSFIVLVPVRSSPTVTHTKESYSYCIISKSFSMIPYVDKHKTCESCKTTFFCVGVLVFLTLPKMQLRWFVCVCGFRTGIQLQGRGVNKARTHQTNKCERGGTRAQKTLHVGLLRWNFISSSLLLRLLATLTCFYSMGFDNHS